MAKKRKPQPIAPPPQSSALRSRKRARQVTTLFHKYTQELDLAIDRAREGGCSEVQLSSLDGAGNESKCDHESISSEHKVLLDEVNKWKDKICEIGGREEYQRASQLNTSLFSTSKWVLGVLGRWGWLDGLSSDDPTASEEQQHIMSTQKKKSRRDVRLLEIGAINTQLLDAAARTRVERVTTTDDDNLDDKEKQNTTNQVERVHRLQVQAIDLRSTNPRIEQKDFFELPLSEQPYDVLVNSMVINCVTTPEQRGRMLTLCYNQLRPGGVCFLTLPKLCLIQSKYMTRSYFEQLLTKGVGFELDSTKDSPKVAFFVLKRPQLKPVQVWNEKYARMTVINKGKKFRNTFAVTLDHAEVTR
mmetsp:Transcript_29268/g.47434  ORF Transcript_29268/g.47434 Transcript_29268/m.47434 type:complete len:359 (+) Transcript_29268:115-1191(+)